MKFMHDPSTITVKPQKFNPQIKWIRKIYSPQNIHAIRYYIRDMPKYLCCVWLPTRPETLCFNSLSISILSAIAFSPNPFKAVTNK